MVKVVDGAAEQVAERSVQTAGPPSPLSVQARDAAPSQCIPLRSSCPWFWASIPWGVPEATRPLPWLQ